MLMTANSFCFFEIKNWSFDTENFYFLTQKLKPVEMRKVAHVTRAICQYLAAILSYLKGSFSVSF